MSIKAAVFDLGGVLEIVDDDAWLPAWAARWEALVGAAPGTVAASPQGELTEAGLRARVSAALALSEQDADRMMVEFWDAYCGVLDETMRDFVRGLKGTLRVASLSNSADGARREEERRHGLAEIFDVLVYSDEIGIEKPHAGIYRHTQKLLGVLPHEIVFVDDRAVAIEGATAAGWHGVMHTDAMSTIAAVRGLIAAM